MHQHMHQPPAGRSTPWFMHLNRSLGLALAIALIALSVALVIGQRTGPAPPAPVATSSLANQAHPDAQHHAGHGPQTSAGESDNVIQFRLSEAVAAEEHGHSHWVVSAWHPSIQDVRIVGTEAQVLTTLPDDAASKATAAEMCEVVVNLTYVDRINGTVAFDSIVIFGAGESVLLRGSVLTCL
jgi:hypothetical protein